MKKTDDVLICAHCGQVIDGREGGPVKIPFCISNMPDRVETLHNKCLRPRIEYLEQNRPRIVGGMVGK